MNGPEGPGSLAGQLLVATPVTGEFFHRSVVLILHHDEDGATGITLNKPMSAQVSAVLPEWQPHVTAPGVLFQGGPVQTDSAMGLVSVPGGEAVQTEALGIAMLFGGLALVDLDAPPPVVVPELAGLRIFVGYAGWGAGQLEAELIEGAWYVVEREPRDPFHESADLWRDVLVRQRNSLSMLANYTTHPEQN
ncbi:YqgE/AlgH family protein [Ornithinimicrobium sp. F0845]|uniref:YqgE/AlgH family protein n=1 Tax=Ornithinimicrobium sp. F0845 TaxID=2926412 RepID=UPI001FF25644|nr:YqgE/AlgH family protein [Ornithinimicrobium sp. F0845]